LLVFRINNRTLIAHENDFSVAISEVAALMLFFVYGNLRD
jgi:hypothetical protein